MVQIKQPFLIAIMGWGK